MEEKIRERIQALKERMRTQKEEQHKAFYLDKLNVHCYLSGLLHSKESELDFLEELLQPEAKDEGCVES